MNESILNQVYMTANDLKKIMPTVGIHQCREYIKEIRRIEEEKGIYVPNGKVLIAPTKAIRKYFGI